MAWPRTSCVLALLLAAACSGDIGEPAEVLDAGQSSDARVADTPDAEPAACTEGDYQVVNPMIGSCYMLFETPATWEQARTACLGIGADLAVLDSEAEVEFLRPLAPGVVDVWIGGTDEATEGVWLWVDGSGVAYDNWREGEPNDAGGENCMIVEADTELQTWDDRGCTDLYDYLCER